MKLYFPTTSLNFNDMFATESISPKIYYSRRIFGTRRHFSTELSFDDSYIFLFKRIPYFQLIDNKKLEFEEFPMILELDLDTKKYPLHKINDEVYAVNKTIYFNLSNLRVFFVSSEDMQKVMQKSKLIIETKCVSKYRRLFDVLNPNSEILKINKFLNLSLTPYNISVELKQDQLFNNIKGLFYAYCYKKYFSSNENEKILREIAFGLNDILTKSEKLSEESEVINDILLLAKNQIKKQYLNYKNQNYSYFEVKDTFEFSYEKGIKFTKKILNEASEIELFEKIINYLINNPKQRVGYLEKDEINSLVENLINLVNLDREFASLYSDDISLIYNRFKLNDYEVDIKHLKSIVLQNFYAFLLKYNNLDELKLYIETKGLKNQYILYSFIGSFVGYSGLDREFTEKLFQLKDEKLFKNIDSYLEEIRENILISVKKLDENTKGSIQINLFEESNVKSNNKNFIESGLSDNKNYIDDLYKEIQKIKQNKSIHYFLKLQQIILDDGLKINFKKEGNNVVISLKNKLNNFEILLMHKDNVSEEELELYKQELKLLGVKQVSTRSNFPISRVYKLDNGKKHTISHNEEKWIFNCVRLINRHVNK